MENKVTTERTTKRGLLSPASATHFIIIIKQYNCDVASTSDFTSKTKQYVAFTRDHKLLQQSKYNWYVASVSDLTITTKQRDCDVAFASYLTIIIRQYNCDVASASDFTIKTKQYVAFTRDHKQLQQIKYNWYDLNIIIK